MPNNMEYTPIPAIKLRNALKSLEGFMGEAPVTTIMKNMARIGIDLNNEKKSYYAYELEAGLKDAFGENAVKLFMRKIKQELEKN